MHYTYTLYFLSTVFCFFSWLSLITSLYEQVWCTYNKSSIGPRIPNSLIFNKYNNVVLLKEGGYIFKCLSADLEYYTLFIWEPAINFHLTIDTQFHVKLKLLGGLYVLKMWKFRICVSYYVRLREKTIQFKKSVFIMNLMHLLQKRNSLFQCNFLKWPHLKVRWCRNDAHYLCSKFCWSELLIPLSSSFQKICDTSVCNPLIFYLKVFRYLYLL